jgi:hypothetical protein
VKTGVEAAADEADAETLILDFVLSVTPFGLSLT